MILCFYDFEHHPVVKECQGVTCHLTCYYLHNNGFLHSSRTPTRPYAPRSEFKKLGNNVCRTGRARHLIDLKLIDVSVIFWKKARCWFFLYIYMMYNFLKAYKCCAILHSSGKRRRASIDHIIYRLGHIAIYMLSYGILGKAHLLQEKAWQVDVHKLGIRIL
jgi:hypothetical protein